MVGLKIALLLVKSVFINVGEGMSELRRQVAAKHTTLGQKRIPEYWGRKAYKITKFWTPAL